MTEGKEPMEQKQIVEYSQPITLNISTNAKGQHQWEIKMSGSDIDQMVQEVERIDDRLTEKYKGERA